jgi:hypothetical protein
MSDTSSPDYQRRLAVVLFALKFGDRAAPHPCGGITRCSPDGRLVFEGTGRAARVEAIRGRCGRCGAGLTLRPDPR